MRVRPSHSARALRIQQVVAAIVPAVIVLLSVTGFMWAQREITVVVDGRSLDMKTQARDVGSLLAECEIPVDSADLVSPARETRLHDGDTVVVRHSIPVTLDLSGNRVDVDVVGETVADALIAVGADPSSNPAVEPSLDTSLQARMTIVVPDVFVRISRAEAKVQAPERMRKDSSMPVGTKRVIVAGTSGRVMRVYRSLVLNGAEGSPVLVAEYALLKPQARIVAVGTAKPKPKSPLSLVSHKKKSTRSKSPAPAGAGREVRVEATGYSARQPGLSEHTATGRLARHGVIAVDPHFIPLGTRVYVPGYGYAVAADTGGAINGRRIDLCFNTVDEAIQWGRRSIRIIVLD